MSVSIYACVCVRLCEYLYACAFVATDHLEDGRQRQWRMVVAVRLRVDENAQLQPAASAMCLGNTPPGSPNQPA